MANIKDFVRGPGPEIQTGYCRGDSWKQAVGDHSECEEKVYVVGPGIGRDAHGRRGSGVLVRCGGCLMSWVLR